MGDELIRGPVTTHDIATARRDYDVAKTIARLYPDASPFAVLLRKARKKPVHSSYFYWYDQRLAEWWGSVVDNEAIASGVTTIPVDDAGVFVVNDLVKVPSTGEQMFVTELDLTVGANAIKVIRGYGDTSAAEIPNASPLLRLASAMEEFSNAPQSRILQPTMGENFTQILRTPFDESMTSTNERKKTSESERVRLRKDKGVEHNIDLERVCLLGEPKKDADRKRQTMGGLLHFIKDNVVNVAAGGHFDEAALDLFCSKLFDHGTNTKRLLVCSNKTLGIIHSFARDSIRTSTGEETYGMRLKYIITAWGDLYLVPSKVLSHAYEGYAFGIDLENIDYCPYRDTILKTNIQAPDADGWRDEYLTEASLRVRLPETHWYMTGAATP